MNEECRTVTVPVAALSGADDPENAGGETRGPAKAGEAVQFTVSGKVAGVDEAGNATVEIEAVNGQPVAAEAATADGQAEESGPSESDVRAMAENADRASGADNYI